MKKLFVIVLMCVFALSFVGGVLASNAQAKIPFCTKTCIDGVAWVCCPQGQSGKWRCFWDGPCDL